MLNCNVKCDVNEQRKLKEMKQKEHRRSEVSFLDWAMNNGSHATHGRIFTENVPAEYCYLELSPWNRISDDPQLGSSSQLAASCS